MESRQSLEAWGIALAGQINAMNLTSPAYRVAHTGAKAFDSFLSEIKRDAKADGGTASNQIRQRQAIVSLDIPKELDMTLGQAAKTVHAKLLIKTPIGAWDGGFAPGLEPARGGYASFANFSDRMATAG